MCKFCISSVGRASLSILTWSPFSIQPAKMACVCEVCTFYEFSKRLIVRKRKRKKRLLVRKRKRKKRFLLRMWVLVVACRCEEAAYHSERPRHRSFVLLVLQEVRTSSSMENFVWSKFVVRINSWFVVFFLLCTETTGARLSGTTWAMTMWFIL